LCFACLLPALLVALALGGDAVAARTFYVNDGQGDDRSDGLSPNTAWRTLEKVNDADLRPGDDVLFRRGGVWRGQLVPKSGATGAPVTYGAYDQGDKPRLLGSVAMNRAEDWQSAGDGLWATAPPRYEPLTNVADLAGAPWWLYTEGGADATMTKVDRGYRIVCRHGGTAAHHLQLSAPLPPLRAGECYVVSLRVRATRPCHAASTVLMASQPPWTPYAESHLGTPAFDADWSDVSLPFMCRRTAGDARLTLFLGGVLPDGVEIDFQPGKLITARCSQSQPLSVDVGNLIFDGGPTCGVKRWSEAELRADGDYFYDAGAQRVVLRSPANPATLHHSLELALCRHIVNHGNCSWATFEGLDLRYGAAHGFGGSNARHVTIRGCDLSFIGGGHQFTPANGRPVRYGNGIEFWADAHDCLVEGCRLWEIYDAALTDQGSGTNVQENLTYRNNVIWNSEYSFEFWNRGPESHTRRIRFEHNTCVDAGKGWGHAQRPDPNGRHLMFWGNTAQTEDVIIRGNVFAGATDSLMRQLGKDWTVALTLDGNLWWQTRGPYLLWDTATIDALGFGAFMAEHKLDVHATVAEPKFVDAAKRDYRLTPDSPRPAP
jgi:hypothetical protein